MRKLIHVSWIALLLAACTSDNGESTDAGAGSDTDNAGSSNSNAGSGNGSGAGGLDAGGASGETGVGGSGVSGSGGADANGGTSNTAGNGGDGNIAGNGGDSNAAGNGGDGNVAGGGAGNVAGNGGSDANGGNGNIAGNGGDGNVAGGGTSNAGGDGNTGGNDSSGGESNQGGDGNDGPDASAGGSGGEPDEPPPPDEPEPDAGADETGCAGGVLGHPTAGFDYPEHAGFKLCMVEEFTDAIDIHGGDPFWTYSDGALVEGAVRHVADGLSFADGNMVITVREQHSNVYWSWAADSFIPQKELTSGELRTKYNNYRYGRYEARLKAPNLIGNFISTMFVFRSPGYQEWREIDVELLGNQPNGMLTNLIVANDQDLWSPQIEEPAYNYPFGPATSGLPAGYNNRTAFHNYAFEWTPNQVRWYVDDNLVRVKVGGVGEDHLPVPDLPAKIIMNTWVFSNADFAGNPALNVYPFTSQYEWFRFYKWDGETKYPCANPPGCLSAEDLDHAKNNPEDGIPNY